ncbi:MAG: GTP cyclohydrolase II [Bacteroidota bacterium]
MSTKLSLDATLISQLLDRQAEAILPTPYGDLRMIAYSQDAGEYAPHLAMAHPDLDPDSEVVVRVHSECITGDLFGSQRCDCGAQLDYALKTISEKKGVVLYLRQEGRGIGIINKLKAYQLQDEGLDTIEANLHLGLEIDARHYDIAQQMLVDLGIKRIKLLTNNPEKIHAFDHGPVELVRRLPIVIDPTHDSEAYLATKRDAMGHLL